MSPPWAVSQYVSLLAQLVGSIVIFMASLTTSARFSSTVCARPGGLVDMKGVSFVLKVEQVC